MTKKNKEKFEKNEKKVSNKTQRIYRKKVTENYFFFKMDFSFYLRGIRHIKIGRPSNLLRMVGSVFTSTLTGTGTKDSRTGTAFPPPLVGAGLCPFRLLGVDFLTAKMLLMAAFFLSDSPAAGVTSEVTGCEADWLLRR